MQRLIKSGVGWRVGWYSQVEKYQGLIGTDDWAIELTRAELTDFKRLLTQLVDTMKQMEAELMEGEKINCEVESTLLWLEVEGYPSCYSLRVIIHGDRRGEGNWIEGIAPELLKGLNSLGFGEQAVDK